MNIKKNLITLAIVCAASTAALAQSNAMSKPFNAGADIGVAGNRQGDTAFPLNWNSNWQRVQYKEHRQEMKDKWAQMTPAEKEQAKTSYKQRWDAMTPEQQQHYRDGKMRDHREWKSRKDIYQGGSK